MHQYQHTIVDLVYGILKYDICYVVMQHPAGTLIHIQLAGIQTCQAQLSVQSCEHELFLLKLDPAAAKVSPVSSDDPSNPGLEPVSRPTPTSRWCRRWQRWHTQSCVAGLALAVKQKSSSCVALAVKLKVASLIRWVHRSLLIH